MSVLCEAIVLLLLALPVVGQPQAFERISIKPARSGDARNMRMRVLPSGDLNATAVPVVLLLRYAYDVPFNPSPRLSGLPGWRETYDIEAKAPANAIPDALPESEKRRRRQGMIRGLLADRFKLVMRVEHKVMPVYALTVASGGPNLQKSTLAEKDCIFDTGAPESCHNFIAGRGHPLNARAINMDDLAHYIENWTDLPVVNRTAVSGLFAVETEGWTPMRLPPPPPGNSRAARFDDLPTIFNVLRKLGLELKKQEATVPVYTVEHIERPAAGRAALLAICFRVSRSIWNASSSWSSRSTRRGAANARTRRNTSRRCMWSRQFHHPPDGGADAAPRARLNGELPDALRDRPSVERLILESPKDQQVKGS